jgi:hypothetical protein
MRLAVRLVRIDRWGRERCALPPERAHRCRLLLSAGCYAQRRDFVLTAVRDEVCQTALVHLDWRRTSL